MSTVPLYLDLLGALPDKYPDFMKKFGDFETKMLTFDIEDLKITRPVFVCGLARAGSTLLIEILASDKNFATHQYRDFPLLHINYFWNSLQIFLPTGGKKTERPHKDGMMINTASPEAADEILWRSFFESLHDPARSNVLGADTANLEFEKFYREHILKLLALRKGARFACKNNYNTARIRYLKKLFPGALFIIPVRKPVEHVYSCLKQHRLIASIQQKDRRARRYMARNGHFEFGLDFAPVNFGDDHKTAQIMELWRAGNNLGAYAHYWADAHDYIADLAAAPDLKDSLRIVKYDALCANTESELGRLCAFTGLNEKIIPVWKESIKPPAYYTPDLSAAETAMIENVTAAAAAKFWS